MSRNSHTISQFKGIMASDSVVNVAPGSALDCLNVYGDSGGWLNVMQRPSTLIDWSLGGNAATNLSAILSLGFLPVANQNPRLMIQQGGNLMYADYPYTAAVKYGGGPLAGLLARLDYAVADGLTFFCNGQQAGYVMPVTNVSGDPTRWFNWGILPPAQAPKVICSTSNSGSITIQRTAGITTVTFGVNHGGAAGSALYVDSVGAPWDASFEGLWKIATVASVSVLTFLQPGLPDAGPFTRASFPGLPATTTGYQWSASYGSTPVAHFSSVSPLSTVTPVVLNAAPVLLIPPSPDPQVNQVALFRNQDGGGSQLLTNAGDQTTGIVTPILTGDFAGYYVLLDNTTDEQLATSGQTAPFDNGVAPLGKFLAVWLDRVLMCGITSDPTGVRYTGFDSINFGRPQMCWCQFNEVKLGQGEAYPCGMGLLRYGGMVFFATNGYMYIYRGTLNDITVSAPTSLSFYAEQLPYRIGLYSHYSVQSTPIGLVWLDDGLNLRVFENSGFYPPKALAPNLAGLLKRLTPGMQDKIESAYVNYLQRDWYLLAVPVDGSPTCNMLIIVDVGADQARNTGAWPTDYAVNGLQWLEYADNSRHLIAALPFLPGSIMEPTAGYLTEIPLIDNVKQGVSDNSLPSPANPPLPGAYWQGGYFGIHDEQGEDEFSMMKMFRYTRHASNVKDAIRMQGFVVDGETATFDNPTPISIEVEDAVGGVNYKGRALSPLIRFPDDSPVCPTLTVLMLAWIETSER